MPLNPSNSRNAHRTVYAGLTFAVVLRRRNADGTMRVSKDQAGNQTLPVQENWVAYTETQTEQVEGNQTITRRDWLLFNDGCGGCHEEPPGIGDQIVWPQKGTTWDIPLDARITSFDTMCYGFEVINTVKTLTPVNG